MIYIKTKIAQYDPSNDSILAYTTTIYFLGIPVYVKKRVY